MTLGGLALAVGILVDDATVTIENIHRNIARKSRCSKRSSRRRSDRGARVRFDVLDLHRLPPGLLPRRTGAALFKPLAMAVIFAMIASYFLSRTLVPTMARTSFRQKQMPTRRIAARTARPSVFRRVNARFDRAIRRFRVGVPRMLLGDSIGPRCSAGPVVFVLASLLLVPLIGEDFFPPVDGGQFQLHVRAASGTRLEETEKLFSQMNRPFAKTFRRTSSGSCSTTSACPSTAWSSPSGTTRR